MKWLKWQFQRAKLFLFLFLSIAYASTFDVPWGGFAATGGESDSPKFTSSLVTGDAAGVPMAGSQFASETGLLAPPPSIRFPANSEIKAGPHWKMVSLFYEPETSEVSTLFPVPALKIYYWDPQAPFTEEFMKFVRPAQVKLGKSVWMKLPESSATFSLRGLAIDHEAPYLVSLGAGWNQIANPFTFSIPFGSIQVVVNGVRISLQEAITSGYIKNALFAFDGSGYKQFDDATGVLKPGEGYFVFTTVPLELLYFPVPQNFKTAQKLSQLPDAPHRTKAALKNSESREWTAKISAKNDLAEDGDNYFGVRLSAKDKSDDLDVPEPPLLENDLALFFPEDSDSLSNSFKSSSLRWNLVVKSKHNKLPVTLFWEGDSSFMEEGAVLIDWQRHDFVDMTQQTSYTFYMPLSNEAQFEIRAGKEAEGLFKLERAFTFPNPTSSTISLMLEGKGKPGPVEVEIYNVSGRKLMTSVLFPEGAGKGRYKARAKEAEESSKNWANGVYFYRLKASNGLGGETVTVGKLVLLR